MAFPKVDCCTPIYADELNYMYDPYDIKASMLENAVNVTKLNYCYSVTEIDHDYMVVDVMTDSTGYNNSICTTDSTSVFNGSALTGYYFNGEINNLTQNVVYCAQSGTTCPTMTVSSFGLRVNGNQYRSCSCMQINSCAAILLNNYERICFQAYRYIALTGSCIYEYSDYIFCFTCFGVDCCFAASVQHGSTTTGTFCISYDKIGTNCYSLSVDGCVLCCVAGTTSINPTLTNHTFHAGLASFVAGVDSRVCLCNFAVFGGETDLSTVPVEYVTSVSTSYLTLDKVGDGSVVYNVYDATTDTLIGCNLEPNTTNSLTSTAQCHYYELIQCSDGVSCIKSYAILAGKV